MNSSLSSRVAWTVWVIASLFYAYQYILRVMPNIILGDIMEHFDISATTFGQFSGIYYIGYSLMHLPIGIMLDHQGPRRVMTGSILLTVIGLLPLIFSNHWAYPMIGRFLIGIGSSAAILGLFKIIRMLFSEERFPRMLSFSVTIGLLGAIYGGGPVSYMREHFGYDAMVQLLAIAGIVLAATTYWFVPNLHHPSHTRIGSDIQEVLTNKRVIGICISAGLMVGPLEGFADVWGSSFFKQVYGFDAILAASLPSVIFIGMCFGAPVLSLIADKIGSYLGIIIIAGMVMISSFYLLLSRQLGVDFLSLNLSLIGICCAYQVLAIYKASTYVGNHIAGLTTALANMLIMLFGYGFHTAIGTVVQATGGVNNPSALLYGVSIIPIALGMGTIGFLILFLTEKKST